MKKIRDKIWYLVQTTAGDGVFTGLDDIYDYTMIALIIVSMVPLAFKGSHPVLDVVDKVCAVAFIIDYAFRWITADYFNPKRGKLAFVIYPFTPMAVLDLLSILPSLSIISSGFRLLKLVRLLRTVRVFRAFKFVRYSKNIKILTSVLKQQKRALGCVCLLALAYVLISALLVFNVEPETFSDYFEAVYWATVSLTTMGYGDIYPVTTFGRIVTMASSFIGIAIVALPAGIITAGYMDALRNYHEEEGNDAERVENE